jgi:hypothetical protein
MFAYNIKKIWIVFQMLNFKILGLNDGFMDLFGFSGIILFVAIQVSYYYNNKLKEKNQYLLILARN